MWWYLHELDRNYSKTLASILREAYYSSSIGLFITFLIPLEKICLKYMNKNIKLIVPLVCTLLAGRALDLSVCLVSEILCSQSVLDRMNIECLRDFF